MELCTVPGHQPGEHTQECVPPANPDVPEIRLIRALHGLCPDHDTCPPGAHLEVRVAGRNIVRVYDGNHQVYEIDLYEGETWTRGYYGSGHRTILAEAEVSTDPDVQRAATYIKRYL